MGKYIYKIFGVFLLTTILAGTIAQNTQNEKYIKKKKDIGEIKGLFKKETELIAKEDYESAGKILAAISRGLEKEDPARQMGIARELADKYHDLGKIYQNGNNCEDSLMIGIYEKSIHLRNKYNKRDSLTKLKISNSYSNIGKIYFNSGDITQSLDNYEKAYQLRSEINNKLKKNKVCIGIGLCYNEIGEYEKAINKYKEALGTTEGNGSVSRDQVKAWNNIGAVYINMDKEKEALPYFESCLSYRKKNKKISELKTTYNNLGKVCLGLGEYGKALFNFRESLVLYGEAGDSIKINEIWNSIGVLLSKQGAFEEARAAIRDSAIMKFPYDSIRQQFNVQYAPSYDNLAYVFLEGGMPDSALFYSRLALNHFLGNNNSYFPEPNSFGAINKIDLLNYQYQLAQVLIAKGEKQEALSVLSYCDSVIIQGIRKSHKLDQSKLFWQGRTRSIYEDAIRMALELGEIETAFNFSQKSKALTLLGKINANIALEETNLPEEIINEKIKLESNIIFLENKIGNNNFSIERLNQAREKYEEFIAFLEKKYPEYHKLKYNTKIPSIKEIQNALLKNNNTAIIEYFLGDSSIYVFGITKKEGLNYHIIKNRNDIIKTTKKLNQLSINRFSKSDEFSEISNKIYQKLIAPITNEITGINKLIIAPDDSLFLIPFKALVMEDSENNFKNLPYMVKNYTINECYSSTFLYTMMTNNENPAKGLNKIKVLGIAPEFNRNSSYGILKENIKDVRQGIRFFNKETSDTLFRQQATARRFTQQLDTGNYDIVYISSHAEKGEQGKDENTIILHESELQQNEIEGLWTSNVKMVVLSACQTGDGETLKGEAPISLGWGFASTNVPSITASLWNMDDEAAGILMNKYFDNLVSRKTGKSEALTEGVRTFLAGNEVGYHPYYWAGIIHYGDDRAIVRSGFSTLLIIGSILSAVILLLGLYLKPQKSLS